MQYSVRNAVPLFTLSTNASAVGYIQQEGQSYRSQLLEKNGFNIISLHKNFPHFFFGTDPFILKITSYAWLICL
jgi:hypothetical protein